MSKSNREGKTSKRWKKSEIVASLIIFVLASSLQILNLVANFMSFEQVTSISVVTFLGGLSFFIWRSASTDEDLGVIRKCVASLERRARTSYRFVKSTNNYACARKLLKDATQAKATFFLSIPWGLRKGESGYEEQVREFKGFPEEARLQYFKELDDKIERGELDYHWIVYVNTDYKFHNLIDRVRSILNASPKGVLRGNTEIYVLPLMDDQILPLPNIQICKSASGANIIVTLLQTEGRLGDSFVLFSRRSEDRKIIEGFEDWFGMLKGISCPVIANGKIRYEMLEKIGLKVFPNQVEHVRQEIEQVRKTEDRIRTTRIRAQKGR